MRRVRFLAVAAVGLLVSSGVAWATQAFEDRTPRVHALVGARVVAAPGEVMENATIVLRDGIIEAVGKVEPPADARLWDLQGLTVYAGLIEPFYGLKKGKKKDADKAGDTEAGVRHPNARVRAERRVVEGDLLKQDDLEAMRNLGFTSAHVVRTDGMFAGQSAFIDLHDGVPSEQVVEADVAQIVRYEHSTWSDENPTYPSSLMGAVALVRQTFNDAAWARDASARYASRSGGLEQPRSNLAWDALAPTLDDKDPMPVWLVTRDVLGSLRSARLVEELDLEAVLVGNGEEYQHLAKLRESGLPTVLPVNYPKAPDVSNEDALVRIELDVLQHWERAPANAARLHEAEMPFALTSHGLKKRSDMRAQVRKAIEAGLPESAALAALTTQPAAILGVDKHYGSIAKGKVAQLTVTDGDLFAKDTKIIEVWVNGDRYDVADAKRDDIKQVQGTWKVVAGDDAAPSATWTLEIKGNQWTLRGTLMGGSGDVSLDDLEWHRGTLRLTTVAGDTWTLEPAGKKELKGLWRQADGTETQLAASRPEEDTEDTEGGAR